MNRFIFRVLLSLFILFGVSCASQQGVNRNGATGCYDIARIHGHVCNGFTCISEVDTMVQRHLLSHGKRLLQIYLIRHAKPNVKKRSFYFSSGLNEYMHSYDEAPIVAFDTSIISVNLRKGHIIYCSNLRRSQETAYKIFGEDYHLVADTIFREFENKAISRRGIIPLPVSLWQGMNRVGWFLGVNDRGIENFGEALQRSREAAENLIKVASIDETAVLVAHGMMNHFIARALKKRGWHIVLQRGNINLGATILVKEVAIDK